MKKLILLLSFLSLSIGSFAQVKIYSDVANLVTVEFPNGSVKKASANSDLSYYNVENYIWLNKSIEDIAESLFRNQRFDSIKNQAGTQLATTLNATLDSIAVIIARSPQSGEANTASNQGTGSGLFIEKVGDDLHFRSFVSSDSTILFEILNGDIDVTLTNNQTGWGDYVDTQYTLSSPFTVNGGTKVTLPNNAGSIVDPQKPTDIITFYNPTNRIITGRNGDGLLITIEFIVRPLSNQTTRIKTSVDIGGSVGEIYQRELFLTKGVGVDHFYLTTTNAYTLGTWESNGGTVKIEAIGGSVQIYGIRYVLARTHKAR